MKKLLLLSALLAAGFAANAFALSIDVSVNSGPIAGSQLLTFDGLTPGSNALYLFADGSLSFSGDSKAVLGSGGQYAAPYGDATVYLTTGVGSLTFNFNAPVKSFGLLWGSVDNYNTIEFANADSSTSFVPSDIPFLNPITGNQGAAGTAYVNFFTTDGSAISTVTLTSSSYAFEVDNVSYNKAPDAAATLGLFAFAMSGLVWLRRRK